MENKETLSNAISKKLSESKKSGDLLQAITDWDIQGIRGGDLLKDAFYTVLETVKPDIQKTQAQIIESIQNLKFKPRFEDKEDIQNKIKKLMCNMLKLHEDIATEIIQGEPTAAYLDFLKTVKILFSQFQQENQAPVVCMKKPSEIYAKATKEIKDKALAKYDEMKKTGSKFSSADLSEALENEKLADKQFKAAMEADKKMVKFNDFVLKNWLVLASNNTEKSVFACDNLFIKKILQPTYADSEMAMVGEMLIDKIKENDENSLNLNAATLKILLKTSANLNLKTHWQHNILISKDTFGIDFDFKINEKNDNNCTIEVFIKKDSPTDFTVHEKKFFVNICSSIETILKEKNSAFNPIEKTEIGKSCIYNLVHVSDQSYNYIKQSINILKKQNEFSIPISGNKINKNGKLNIYDLSEFKGESSVALFNLIKEVVNEQLKDAIASPIKNLFLLDLSPPLVIEITLDATFDGDFKKGSIKNSLRNSTKKGEILFISGPSMSLTLMGPLSSNILPGIYDEFNKDKEFLSNSQANLVTTYYSICQIIQKHLGIESIGNGFRVGIDKKSVTKSAHRLNFSNISDITYKTLEKKNKTPSLKEYLKRAIKSSPKILSEENIFDIFKNNLGLTKLFSERVLKYDDEAIGISDEGQHVYLIKPGSDENEWILVRENTDDLIHSMLFKLAEGKKQFV